MNSVLVIGGGGREHAICHSLSKSPKVDKIYCLPGNAGISEIAECAPVSATDFDGILAFIKAHDDIKMTVVAPDDPLALGLVDLLESNGYRAFGPRKNAAIIEASKAFSKALMKKYGIPTAAYEEFDDVDKAKEYAKKQSYPLVVKADGRRNPEDLCVQDGKLYVSNSGGLDWEGIGVDRTVSVVDLDAFREVKQIEVGPNPGKILAGQAHTVWVATYGGNIEEGDYHLVKINAQTDAVEAVYDEPVMDFAIDYNLAYLYNYDYQTNRSSVKVFDLASGKVAREQFITDGTKIERPYAIAVNPYSSNVYITEAYNYQVEGDLLCFAPDGKLMFRLNGVGLNPNTVLFRDVSASVDDSGSEDNPDAPSAFADKVFEYVPAPTQFMNTVTVAYQEGFNEEDRLSLASERLRKRSLLSLGAYGGYIVVGFSQPVPNVEGAYDFKIYGNANYNPNAWQDRPGGSAEPGIVLVSKDENENGMPDDPWYELAGSEYGKDTETRDYEITYYRPQPENADVRWTDNQGNEGYVYRNDFHTQNSYYPAWVEEDRITFRGTRLEDNVVEENGIWVGYAYDWGYADNHPNDTEFSQFKIEWAVDAEGHPIQLDEIDFVKIYTAVNQYAGQVGELSTEITGVENLHFGQ